MKAARSSGISRGLRCPETWLAFSETTLPQQWVGLDNLLRTLLAPLILASGKRNEVPLQVVEGKQWYL